MLPKLVISNDPEKRIEYTEQTVKELQVTPFNLFTVSPQEGSISIDQMRQINGLFLTRSPDLRVIVIDSFDLATIEAQNSLLKILEEKTDRAQFILFAGHAEGVIATIRSRVRTIRLQTVPETDVGGIIKTIADGGGLSFLNSPEHQLKTKEDVLERIDQFIYYFHNVLAANPDSSISSILKKLMQTREEVRQCNVNPQYAYDILLIFIARAATMK